MTASNDVAIYEMVVEELADEILQKIFAMRRLLPVEIDRPYVFDSEAAPHREKIIRAIKADQPIRMVLPAFPAKSPNRRKTLSHLPDFAEEIAFANLFSLCQQIKAVYKAGAKLTVCSDGRVFADVVHIPDQDVTEYNEELRRLYKERYNGVIEFFDLDDVYPGMKDFALLREDLMVLHGEPIQSLRERCKTEAAAGEMYKGITRFLLEDYSGLQEFQSHSRNGIQNYARVAAYRVIQRSNAWSRLVEKHFPESLRLSIHPQFRVSEKIGINLISANDCWSTPWHSVALKVGSTITLVPRHEAESRNAMLVFFNGRPSHFTTSHEGLVHGSNSALTAEPLG